MRIGIHLDWTHFWTSFLEQKIIFFHFFLRKNTKKVPQYTHAGNDQNDRKLELRATCPAGCYLVLTLRVANSNDFFAHTGDVPVKLTLTFQRGRNRVAPGAAGAPPVQQSSIVSEFFCHISIRRSLRSRTFRLSQIFKIKISTKYQNVCEQ